MITDIIEDKNGTPVVVSVAYQHGDSEIRIGEYRLDLNTFLPKLLFELVGKHVVIGYLNKQEMTETGKHYELRKPRPIRMAGSHR